MADTRVFCTGLFSTKRILWPRYKKRVSVAILHGFSMDKKVTAVKEMVDEQYPKRYKKSSFRDFLDYIEATDITKGKSFIDSLRLTST